MHAVALARALSEQDLFKKQYTPTLRWSVLGALVVLVLVVYLMPEFRPEAYRLRENVIVVTDVEVEAPVVDDPPPAVSAPKPIIIAPSDDLSLEPVEVPDIDKLLLPVPPPGGWVLPGNDTPFVASAEKPALLRGAVADYPEMARLAGMQGTVVVKVLVAPDGSVERAEILKGVHPLLNQPALKAAKKFVFKPGTQRGVPVQCWMAIPFRFGLN